MFYSDGRRYVSSPEAARLAGCTYRQLDYWCRTDVLRPAIEANGSGSRRGYSPRQVQLLALATVCSSLGVHGDLLTEVLATAAELGQWLGHLCIYPDGVVTYEQPIDGPACWVINLDKIASPVREHLTAVA
jgi:DNA-binding transcriptional MerR regulator